MRRSAAAARLGRDTRALGGARDAAVERVPGFLGSRPALGALPRARCARPARAVDQSVQDPREACQPAPLVSLPRADFVEVRAVHLAGERVDRVRRIRAARARGCCCCCAIAARRVLGVFFLPARVRHHLLLRALHRAQVRLPLSHNSSEHRTKTMLLFATIDTFKVKLAPCMMYFVYTQLN